MAAVSLFWDNNMAAVTSCENTLHAALCVESSFQLNVVEPKPKQLLQPNTAD